MATEITNEDISAFNYTTSNQLRKAKEQLEKCKEIDKTKVENGAVWMQEKMSNGNRLCKLVSKKNVKKREKQGLKRVNNNL